MINSASQDNVRSSVKSRLSNLSQSPILHYPLIRYLDSLIKTVPPLPPSPPLPKSKIIPPITRFLCDLEKVKQNKQATTSVVWGGGDGGGATTEQKAQR